jgi:tRNA U34 5-carboxymethylaminomethyl modifying GTPase MnmE/TrmE
MKNAPSFLGTTRDTIEDELVIGGIGFRFRHGRIRETQDVVESIGIRKTFENRTVAGGSLSI